MRDFFRDTLGLDLTLRLTLGLDFTLLLVLGLDFELLDPLIRFPF